MAHAFERSDYHEENPEWRTRFRGKGRFIGVELEVETGQDPEYDDEDDDFASPTGGGYAALMALLPQNKLATERFPIVEEDGSLNYDRGMEIVFPPISYAHLRDRGRYFGKTLAALGEHTSLSLHSQTGMHMNVNCNGWPDRKCGYFVGIINHMEQVYLERMGGRGLTHYCSQNRNSVDWSDYTEEDFTGHTAAAETPYDGRIECRFPKATVDHGRVDMLLTFFEELEDFCDEANRQDEDKLVNKLAQEFQEAVVHSTTKNCKLLAGVWRNGYTAAA